MIGLRARLAADQKGIAAMEFALAAPVIILLFVGLAQIGMLFLANAGLNHAVTEAARYATLYPRPADSAITTRLTSSAFGLTPSRLTVPSLVHGATGGLSYVEVSATYVVPLDFVLIPPISITLSSEKRAFQM